MRSIRRGAISTPRLATAPATIIIWSGVTVSRSWPMAMRAVSSPSSSLGSTVPPSRRPETSTESPGRSTGGFSPKP